MIRPEDFEDDDGIDDDEFEEWCEMSEEQQDAILAASMRYYVANTPTAGSAVAHG